jgi:hypothetical protein
MAPTAYLEQLEYDARLMNQALIWEKRSKNQSSAEQNDHPPKVIKMA